MEAAGLVLLGEGSPEEDGLEDGLGRLAERLDELELLEGLDELDELEDWEEADDDDDEEDDEGKLGLGVCAWGREGWVLQALRSESPRIMAIVAVATFKLVITVPLSVRVVAALPATDSFHPARADRKKRMSLCSCDRRR